MPCLNPVYHLMDSRVTRRKQRIKDERDNEFDTRGTTRICEVLDILQITYDKIWLLTIDALFHFTLLCFALLYFTLRLS